jgi:hypothetical protein
MNWSLLMARSLMPLFDRYGEYSRRLVKLGFDDALFFDDYLDSFAVSREELALSRKIRAELARRSCWSDCFLGARNQAIAAAASPAPFDGNWLDRMLDARRQDLRASGEYEAAERIRAGDLDPCRIRERAWAMECEANRRYLDLDFAALQLRRREEEALVLHLVPRVAPANEAPAIMDFVEQCLLAGLRDRSWRRIKRSDGQCVFLAKRLSDDLELRFVVSGSEWNFGAGGKARFGNCAGGEAQAGGIDLQPPNCLDLSLGLHARSGRIRRFGGIPRADIPFTRLVPFCDQGKYRNATHLAVAIAGWTALYRFVSREIEDAALACWRAARH